MGPRWDWFKDKVGDTLLPTEIGKDSADRLSGMGVLKNIIGNKLAPSQILLPQEKRLNGFGVIGDLLSGGVVSDAAKALDQVEPIIEQGNQCLAVLLTAQQLAVAAGTSAAAGAILGTAVGVPLGALSKDKPTASFRGYLGGGIVGVVGGTLIGNAIFPGLGTGAGLVFGGGFGTCAGGRSAVWSFDRYGKAQSTKKLSL